MERCVVTQRCKVATKFCEAQDSTPRPPGYGYDVSIKNFRSTKATNSPSCNTAAFDASYLTTANEAATAGETPALDLQLLRVLTGRLKKTLRSAPGVRRFIPTVPLPKSNQKLLRTGMTHSGRRLIKNKNPIKHFDYASPYRTRNKRQTQSAVLTFIYLKPGCVLI